MLCYAHVLRSGQTFEILPAFCDPQAPDLGNPRGQWQKRPETLGACKENVLVGFLAGFGLEVQSQIRVC